MFNAKYWNFYIDFFLLQELKGKQWQLANYFEIHKSLAFHVEKSYFASIIRVTRLSNTRHSLIINPWAWITRFRQFTIIEPTSIIKLHISIYWQKTWISGFSCERKLVFTSLNTSRLIFKPKGYFFSFRMTQPNQTKPWLDFIWYYYQSSYP